MVVAQCKCFTQNVVNLERQQMDGYDKARDHYDNLLKAANYLLVGHSAGLVGCLSVFKDYQNVPELKGVGLFILLFGTGLLTAVMLYGSILIGRMELLRAIHSTKPPTGLAARAAYWCSVVGVWISVAAFVYAVVVVMYRFASL
jgi:hypothetical protein